MIPAIFQLVCHAFLSITFAFSDYSRLVEARNCRLRSKRNQNPNRSNKKDRKLHRISNPKPVSIFAKTENQMLKDGKSGSLNFLLTGIRGTNTIYFWSQLFAQHTQATTRYLCVSLFDIFVLFRVNTLLSFCKNADITYNVSSNPLTPQKISLACIACLCLT